MRRVYFREQGGDWVKKNAQQRTVSDESGAADLETCAGCTALSVDSKLP